MHVLGMLNLAFMYLRNVFFIAMVCHMTPPLDRGCILHQTHTPMVSACVSLLERIWFNEVVGWPAENSGMFLAREYLVRLRYCMVSCGIFHNQTSLLISFSYIMFSVSQLNTWLLKQRVKMRLGEPC